MNSPFTDTALLEAWKEFAETRKMHQADYFLLNQPYERIENNIVVPLTNALQETMLNEFKLELITFLRDRLRNTSLTVVGELREVEDKRMIYTPRDKFEYLIAKNPLIKDLKDRLGLDPDY